MNHSLKTDPEAFQAVWDGRKTCELRFDDRGFTVADGLRLMETKFTGVEMKQHGAPLMFTGRELYTTVRHLLRGPVYGLADGWVILSISPYGAKRDGPPEPEQMRDAK